jgi:hypothetical protein
MGEKTNTNIISSKLLVYGRKDKYKNNNFIAACLMPINNQLGRY